MEELKIGMEVKRIGDKCTEGGNPAEAMGMIGTIISIRESYEWPPNSTNIIPKIYFIDFPDLYKGTQWEGVKLGVIKEDLEIV